MFEISSLQSFSECCVVVQGDGSTITVEPGLIGGEINRILARHKAKHNHPIQYKIGPDPSSIDSCMVGGMVSNNSSGMCCGVSQNTYHTLKDMRIVFLDGTVLDTANPKSRESFLQVIQYTVALHMESLSERGTSYPVILSDLLGRTMLAVAFLLLLCY